MRSKSRRIPERLQDVLEAIGNAKNDIGDLTKMQFASDGKTQRAVIESLIVIGEAANNIMQQDPGIEQLDLNLWAHLKDSYDMRIILTHEYFRVDTSVVWETIHKDIPVLASLIESFISTSIKAEPGSQPG